MRDPQPWSTPADVAKRVRRRWDSGALLTACAHDTAWEPFSISLKGPTVSEIGDRLDEVRDWVAVLEKGSRRAGRSAYRIEYRSVGGRFVGSNQIPTKAWLDSYDEAWTLLGVNEEVDRFVSLLETGRRAHPEIGAWMTSHPHRTLQLKSEWPLLIAAIDWMTARSGSGVYLRQVDVPSVDTKFIEGHRGVLSEILDRVLAPERVDVDQPRTAFARRYGFLGKPAYARLRLLSPSARFPETLSELTLRVDELANLDPGLGTVIVVENEVTYLAFPQLDDALVLFGSGYSVSTLARLPWLHDKRLYYWGDIDTHGFAILNRLRHACPDARSLLMDRATLISHRSQWVTEGRQTNAHLVNLTSDETDLYRDLVEGAFGSSVRLEQERVNFQAILDALERLSLDVETETSL